MHIYIYIHPHTSTYATICVSSILNISARALAVLPAVRMRTHIYSSSAYEDTYDASML